MEQKKKSRYSNFGFVQKIDVVFPAICTAESVFDIIKIQTTMNDFFQNTWFLRFDFYQFQCQN